MDPSRCDTGDASYGEWQGDDDCCTGTAVGPVGAGSGEGGGITEGAKGGGRGWCCCAAGLTYSTLPLPPPHGVRTAHPWAAYTPQSRAVCHHTHSASLAQPCSLPLGGLTADCYCYCCFLPPASAINNRCVCSALRWLVMTS